MCLPCQFSFFFFCCFLSLLMLIVLLRIRRCEGWARCSFLYFFWFIQNFNSRARCKEAEKSPINYVLSMSHIASESFERKKEWLCRSLELRHRWQRCEWSCVSDRAIHELIKLSQESCRSNLQEIFLLNLNIDGNKLCNFHNIYCCSTNCLSPTDWKF